METTRFSTWLRRVAVFGGLFCVALGLCGLAGWYADDALLLRIDASLPAMGPTTALGFLLCGAAVLAGAWRRFGLTLLAAGPVVYGLLTLLEMISGGGCSIDHLLIRPAVYAGSQRLIPPSAGLGFLLGGSCLLSLGRPLWKRQRPWVSGVLSSAVLALGCIVLLGYALMGKTITEAAFGNLPVHAAVGFLVLGVGLFALVWQLSGAKKELPRWLPVSVGIAGALAAVVLWQTLRAEEAVRLREACATAAIVARDELKNHLYTAFWDSSNLSKRWESKRVSVGEHARLAHEFNEEVKAGKYLRGLIAVERLDNAGLPRWQMPNGIPMVPGPSVFEKERTDILRASRKRRQTVLSKPLDLGEGRKGLLAAAPVSTDGPFTGWFLTLFSTQEFLDQTVASMATRGYDLVLFEHEQKVCEGPTSAEGAREEGHFTATVGGAAWRGIVRPKPAVLAAKITALPGVAMGACLSLSLLLALAVFLAQTVRRRAERAEAANQQLVGEIALRERTEQALAESERGYRVLFEAMPLPMWVYHMKTLALLAVNDAAVEHYGYTRQEFLFMTVRDIQPPEPGPALSGRQGQIAIKEASSGFRKHRKKDGTLIDVAISSHVLPLGDQQSCLVMARDVTHQLRLEDQLRQAQKMEAVGRLAGGVAHDFNNLLTVITGFSEMLCLRFAAGDPLRDFIDQIHKAGERAASLTQQLLAFGRRQVLRPQVLDLNVALAGTEKMLRRLIGENIELVTMFDVHCGRVKADPGQLEQVIVNLAINAKDAMPEGGTLTFRTANVEVAGVQAGSDCRPGPYVLLEVRDNGCGIPPEILGRIFEPFFTTKDRGRGTGLGLATVYGIVKQSGGHIEVESEPDVGTVFRVYLPFVAPELPEPRLLLPDVPVVGGHETVLLVEDEDAVRNLARRILEEQGYHVLEAADGEEALTLVQRFAGPIGILVTDVIMPRLSGRKLAEVLSARYPGLRVLYMSGYADDVLGPVGHVDKSVAFLQKPFAPAALAREVRKILDQRPCRVTASDN
jgi:two-component system cell cycle sensor histidine kinase/response regulator CckA